MAAWLAAFDLDGMTLGLAAVTFVAGVGLTLLLNRGRDKALKEELERQEEQLKEENQKFRQDLEEASRDEHEQLQAGLKDERKEITAELKDARHELDDLRRDLDKQEKGFASREKKLKQQEQEVSRQEEKSKTKLAELDETLSQEKEQLLAVADMTRDEARELLLRQIEDEVAGDKADIIHRVVEETRDEARLKANEIIAEALVRCASEQTAASTVSTVDLPSDDMKGRIIGREGRNIKAFERATGIDVIVDDTPGVVVLSGFDAVRREIAVQSMKKLLGDGRIHPARIEDVVKSIRKDIDKTVTEIGQRAVLELNITGIQPKLQTHIGKMEYKVLGGQNLLAMSKTVSSLMGVIAIEFGLDADIAKTAGLLCYIGMTEGQETEGTVAHVGSQVAKRYGCKREIVQAIGATHDDTNPSNLYAVLLRVAIKIVRARPGASHEQVQRYIKRLEKIEAIASSLDGVRQAFAIQAGNELRVVVDPVKVNDKMAVKMARDIAKQIEIDASYPGSLTVNLLREARSVAYAK